jgi:hypothetical protein
VNNFRIIAALTQFFLGLLIAGLGTYAAVYRFPLEVTFPPQGDVTTAVFINPAGEVVSAMGYTHLVVAFGIVLMLLSVWQLSPVFNRKVNNTNLDLATTIVQIVLGILIANLGMNIAGTTYKIPEISSAHIGSAVTASYFVAVAGFLAAVLGGISVWRLKHPKARKQ